MDDLLDPPEVPAVKRPGSARLANDPDKYIRTVRGGRFQARPYDMGVRYNLGIFETKHAARKALAEFWWGRRKERFRFARPDITRPWVWYAVVYLPAGEGKPIRTRVGKTYTSAEKAHKAACRWLRRYHPEIAEGLIEPHHRDRGPVAA